MTIRPAIISTMDKKIQDICKNNTCYQAIKYNFVTDHNYKSNYRYR